MEIDDYFFCRKNILEDSCDEFGFISEQQVLNQVLPLMLDAKLLDSEDFNDSYFLSEPENIKTNAYVINESGERLQIFIVNEDTIDENIILDDLKISERSYYENQFKRVMRLLSESIKGRFNNRLQDSDPAKTLVNHLSTEDSIEQFDTIEIFLISLSATVSFKGHEPQPRDIYFDDDKIQFTYSSSGTKKKKEFLILRRVIDLNFIYKVIQSRGNREALTVNFVKTFGYNIEVIQAANQDNFESYLCVLKAEVLADLYKRYSSRLLEKNVRSFLQFKGVNKGLRETIRTEPEKFIAYNNGLTITATKADIHHSNKKMYIESLVDLQIVNGGQTTASIYFSKKDGLDISKIKVMAKINVVKEKTESELDDLIAKISKFSNSQTKVSNVDLRSRNPQLVSLKKLSESINTPSGKKWFFERSKGEFNTELRKAGSNSARIKKEYPNDRRFSKEDLAKYYCAWGDSPYLVKKGGEKVFRYFIESISSDDESKEPIAIDRDFYETLVAKIILFRALEKIYGQGKNSIGQLRSAAVPYVLSVIYLYTDGSKNNISFDLSKIWKKEELDEDISAFFKDLLILMNELIKKYSTSDDVGEFSKKPELWKSIRSCPEVREFMTNISAVKILKKYTK